MVRDHPSGCTRASIDDVKLLGAVPTGQGNRSCLLAAVMRMGHGCRTCIALIEDGCRGAVTKVNAEQRRPVGSPSNEIYYASDEEGRFAIYRGAPTGTIEKVIASSAAEWDPAVVPDRRRLDWDELELNRSGLPQGGVI